MPSKEDWEWLEDREKFGQTLTGYTEVRIAECIEEICKELRAAWEREDGLRGERDDTLKICRGLQDLMYGQARSLKEIELDIEKSCKPIERNGLSPEKRAELCGYSAAWDVCHELLECGHPRSCYQDRNYPASERNYDPETKTSEPPMGYRCVACEREEKLEKALHNIGNRVGRPTAPMHSIRVGELCETVVAVSELVQQALASGGKGGLSAE